MKMRSRLLIAGALAALVAGPAVADLGYNPGSVATIFDFICFTTKHCSAHVPVNSAGTEIGTSSNPFRVDPTGSTTQPVSAASLPLPAGAATSAKQPALGTAGAASTDVLTVQGVASMTPFLNNPGTAANWGIGTSTQNSATVANGQLALAQFNTSPTTITTGNMSPLQMDSGGKLLVNCTGCSASSAITTWAGGTLGAMANYGTSPGAVLAPGVNAFVTNSNSNGRAVSGGSSPVVPTPALSTWHLIAAATTNATSVKGSAATVFSCQLGNNSANIGYLKIYNKATAPTVGTDVPVKTLIIPGPTAGGGGSNISFGPGGLTLSTGFAAAVTGVITDADTTAVAATAFALNCDYE